MAEGFKGYFGEQSAPGWMSQQGQTALMAFSGGMDPQGLLAKLLQILGGSSAMFGGAITPNAMAAQTFMAPALGGILSGPGTPIAGSALSQLGSRAVGGFNLQQAFGSLMGAGGMGAGGMGLGMGAQQGMVDQMQGMTQPGVQMADVSGIVGMGTQGGFFRGITDVRQARAQLQNLTKQVLEMSRELSQSIQETSQAMNQAASLGATGPAGARAVASRMIATAQLTGTDPNQVFSMMQGTGAMGRQFGLSTLAGAEAGAMGFGRAGWAERTGALSQQGLINATGVGGQAGAAALSTSFMATGMQALDRSQTQWMMAAAIDPRSISSGNIQMDQSKLQGMLFGANDPQAIERMKQQAQQNLNMLQQTPGAYATWMRNQPQMMDQFMSATAGMAPLAFAASAASRMGISEDDPNYQLYVSRIYAQQTGQSTRGPGFRDIQRRVGLAIEGGLVGTGAGVAAEQAAVFGNQETRIAEKNAQVVERQREAQLNRVFERTVGDFEARTTAPLVQGAERIANLVSLQLGVGGDPARVAAGVAGAEGARSYFSLAGSVAPTFRDSGADLTRATTDLEKLTTQISQTSDPTVKADLTRRREQLQTDVQRLTSMGSRSTSRYWGGREESYAGTGADIAKARGVEGSVEMIRQRVQQSAGGWDAANAYWEQNKGDADFHKTIAGALSMSEADLDKALKSGTFMDVMAANKDSGGEAALAYVMGKGKGGTVTAEERKALASGAMDSLAAYREVTRAGKGLSYGEALRIGGRETEGGRAQTSYESARAVAVDKFGNEALFQQIGADVMGVASPLAKLLQDPAMAEELKKGVGMERLLQMAQVSPEKQKQLLDSIPSTYRDAQITGQDLSVMLGGLASKQLEQTRSTILASGLLGADAMKAYEGATGEEGTVAGDFARRMVTARGQLAAGAAPEAIASATATVRDAMTGVLRGSKAGLRGVTDLLSRGGELGSAVAGRVRKAYEQRQSGGGWGAEEVTGFGRNFGVDLSQVEGISREETAILQQGGTAAEKLLRNNTELQNRLTGAVSSAMIEAVLPPGRQAGQEDQQRTQAQADSASATQTGMTNALSPMLPLPVKLVLGSTSWSLSPGTPGAQDPPVGGTGETPPNNPASP